MCKVSYQLISLSFHTCLSSSYYGIIYIVLFKTVDKTYHLRKYTDTLKVDKVMDIVTPWGIMLSKMSSEITFHSA